VTTSSTQQITLVVRITEPICFFLSAAINQYEYVQNSQKVFREKFPVKVSLLPSSVTLSIRTIPIHLILVFHIGLLAGADDGFVYVHAHIALLHTLLGYILLVPPRHQDRIPCCRSCIR